MLSASLRLCALLALTAPAFAAEPLLWKWSEGDTQRYVMRNAMETSVDAGAAGEFKTTLTQAISMVWSALEANADGSTRLSQQMERIVMETAAPGGQGFRYDSADEDPPLGMAAMSRRCSRRWSPRR